MSYHSFHRFHDKAASLVPVLGGASNVLMGYRPRGHDVSPDGFGSFRPHKLRFGRVRQFTINVSNNRLQLHIGSGTNEAPTTPIAFVDVLFPGRSAIGGQPLFASMAWEPGNMRWAAEGQDEIRTWIENNARNAIKVVFRPRAS